MRCVRKHVHQQYLRKDLHEIHWIKVGPGWHELGTAAGMPINNCLKKFRLEKFFDLYPHDLHFGATCRLRE